MGLVRDAGAPVYLINLKPFRYPYLGKSPVTFLHESLGKIVMSVKYLQQGPAADENIKMRSILSHISTSLAVLLKDFCNFPLVIDVERIIWPLWEAERNNTTRSTNVQVTSSAPGTFPDVKGEIMVKRKCVLSNRDGQVS